MVAPNKKVVADGYNYAAAIQAVPNTYTVAPADLPKGTYRNITGNQAVAWGLMAAAEKAGLPLFCGSYPITPATAILEELAIYKHLNSLKSEAMGLAVMTELPLVVVDVQRAGPCTGMPTKTEQTDLCEALYGRNGESPMVVLCAHSPAHCFDAAFQAAKIALEHMTPVLLLSEGFLGNGSEPWRIPSMAGYPAIQPRFAAVPAEGRFLPFERDGKTLSRAWATPGRAGLEHRVGGLEKNHRGVLSTDPDNHALMVAERAEKVARVAADIPALRVDGPAAGRLLVVGWGGTYGHLLSAVDEVRKAGGTVSLAHFDFINPLPANTEEVLSGFDRILVCELNSGQFAGYLRSRCPGHRYLQCNKVQGQTFLVEEVVAGIRKALEEE